MVESINSYREICSSETLRSSKKGFFHEFIDTITDTIGSSIIIKSFSKLTHDDERIRRIFTQPNIKNVVLETLNCVKCFYRDKDAQVSRAKRLEGFHYASRKDNEKALLCFSQAVLRAPVRFSVDDEFNKIIDLPLALLGRAETLMALGEYEFALDDLKSIDKNLPDHEKKNLSDKLEECRRLIEESKKPRELCQVSDSKKNVENYYKQPVLPDLTGGIHPTMPGISKLVDIHETTVAGKHAVAADNIQIGDIIVCEPPLSSCLLPEYYGTHCHHCFVRLRAPVGCPTCSTVAFCDRKCRDVAVGTYHKYECKILALLIGSGMSILSMLALRMVTQIGSKVCVQLYNDLKNSTTDIPVDDTINSIKNDVHMSKSSKRRLRKKKLKEKSQQRIDYQAYNLVTLCERRTPKDYFERTLMATFLLKCLQLVDFFDTPSIASSQLHDDEVAVGSIILRNLQLLQFNAHEIFETRLGNDHRFRGSKTVYLGIAVYSSASRFNHDCYPAVTRYFAGRHIILRATRPLKPGEVVAENYGPVFTKRSLQIRRRCLEGRYWFSCACRACLEDWPTFDGLINKLPRIKCPTVGCEGLLNQPQNPECFVKCMICMKKVNLTENLIKLKKCEDDYTHGLTSMEAEQSLIAIEELTIALENFHKIASPPHRPTHLAEIALASCMADSGNVWRPVIMNSM